MESNGHKNSSELNALGTSPHPKIHECRVHLANIDHLLETCTMVKMVEKNREISAESEKSNHIISNVDIDIPEKHSKISISYPGISESRKVENINIVLPPKPTPFILGDSTTGEETDDDGLSIDTNALISEDAFDDTPSFEREIDCDRQGNDELFESKNRKNVNVSARENSNSENILSLSSFCPNPEKTKSKSSILKKIKGMFIPKNDMNKTLVQEKPETGTIFSSFARVFKRKSLQKMDKSYLSGKKN